MTNNDFLCRIGTCTESRNRLFRNVTNRLHFVQSHILGLCTKAAQKVILLKKSGVCSKSLLIVQRRGGFVSKRIHGVVSEISDQESWPLSFSSQR